MRQPLGSYILDENGEPKEASAEEWAEWFRDGEKRVVRRTECKDALVSTVFLGLDHNFSNEGPPILWETIIFYASDEKEDDMYRYDSHEAAVANHERLVAMLEPLPSKKARFTKVPREPKREATEEG